jgi:hypothetical protein
MHQSKDIKKDKKKKKDKKEKKELLFWLINKLTSLISQ